MEPRQHAHDLIDRMAPSPDSSVAGLLEAMLYPVVRSFADAAFDDEPVSEEEARRGVLAWKIDLSDPSARLADLNERVSTSVEERARQALIRVRIIMLFGSSQVKAAHAQDRDL